MACCKSLTHWLEVSWWSCLGSTLSHPLAYQTSEFSSGLPEKPCTWPIFGRHTRYGAPEYAARRQEEGSLWLCRQALVHILQICGDNDRPNIQNTRDLSCLTDPNCLAAFKFRSAEPWHQKSALMHSETRFRRSSWGRRLITALWGYFSVLRRVCARLCCCWRGAVAM